MATKRAERGGTSRRRFVAGAALAGAAPALLTTNGAVFEERTRLEVL